MADRYSGIDLSRGSSHHEQVQTLQRDLRELGFLLIAEPDGTFGRFTFWAVREFQAYAAMAQVGQETAMDEPIYADRLSPVSTGEHRYQGPVSGVVNAATRKALEHWLDSRWRCPVVIEGWRMRNRRRHGIEAQNIWLHDEFPNKSPRMYARDLSGYFVLSGERDADDRIVVGDYATYLSWSGPRSVPPGHTWPEGEILPERLIGRPLDQLSGFERSTFKVVRAVSEVECLGHFDSINAYDNAFISVGPCHWTLGIASRGGNVSEGELCGYLAYLRHADPQAFEKALGFFGVRVDEDWVDSNGVPNGAALFRAGQRKYAGWVALQRDDGSFGRLPEREGEGNYFKTWHWSYRFVMAGRTIPGYQRHMWDMARIRLRDLLDLPWQAGNGTRVGEIFTSEKAIAMILRWHIRFPAHVAASRLAGARLAGALQDARGRAPNLSWNGDPAGWTDAHEAALIAGLRTQTQQAGGGLPNTIKQVDEWPQWVNGSNRRGYRLSPAIGRLSEERGSFQFDDQSLPPAP
jgi:hypothetical protein